jgi:hypothetical protein
MQTFAHTRRSAGRRPPCTGPAASRAAIRQLLHGARVQAKLVAPGRPADPAEQEAEHVAERIGAAPRARHCTTCAPAPGAGVQAKASPAPPSAPLPAALPDPGPGQALPAGLRTDMEARFAADFSGVRLHTGAAAAEAARTLHAHAYTVGRDLVFGAGEFAPHTGAGRRLLAHELTHVLQQGAAQQPRLQRQQLTCSIDIIKAARVFEGDRSAALEVLDCCESGLSPLPAGCTSDLIAAARFLLGRRGGEGGQQCPPGFRRAGSRDFSGQCCPEGIVAENAEQCCPPARIVANAIFPRCCPAGTMPDAERRNCVEPRLPPIEPPPVEEPPSVEPPVEPPVTPPVEPPEPVLPTALQIRFRFDRPAAAGGTLADSLSGEGRTQFDALLAQLRADPALKVQLVGRASAEGPAAYNLALGRRRAALIAAALGREGIARDRVAEPPVDELDPACERGEAGVVSCGELRARPFAGADREVLARIFRPR